MSRGSGRGMLVLVLSLPLALLLNAAGPAAPLEITLTHPPPGQPVFGEVEIVAEVTSGAAREVIFYVDGRPAGTVATPPYRLEIDLGDANREHRFEALAVGTAGEEARALLVTPAIRVDDRLEIELMQLYVTVARQGTRVLDLEAGDFAIVDGGEVQDLVTFARGDVPLAAVLLVDSSDSMRGARLTAALEGARAFAAGMAPLDQAKLLLFSDRIVHRTPFTSFAEVLTTGLGGVEAAGGTALNDHLYLALELLETRQGRRVVILLSDGVDVASVLRMREVVVAARRSQALLYWIRLGAPDPRGTHSSAWRDADEHRQELAALDATVRESGGRILTLSTVADTADAFTRVLTELRQQYVLGYYPSRNRDNGAWHPIQVRVDRPGMRVRVREGYIDD